MIKILFSDFDNTLSRRFGVSNIDKLAIKKLKNNNVDTILTSGRMASNLQFLSKKLCMDTGVIATNGAIVIGKNKNIIFESFISKIALSQLCKILDESNVFYVMYSKDNVYIKYFNCNSNFKKFVFNYIANRLHANLKVVDNIEDINENILKITAWFGKKQDKKNKILKNINNTSIHESITITTSSEKQLEFMNKGVNKFLGIKKYCEYYKIDISEIATIGDYDNDIPMLENVTNSFVVENGSAEAKKVANDIVSKVGKGFAEASLYIIGRNK